ncbi:MAG: hypothetical protein WC184_01385 [Acidimicrobiia bacterium]
MKESIPRHKKRRLVVVAIAIVALTSTVSSVGATENSIKATETYLGDHGAEVHVERGNDCDGTSIEVISGRVDDPTPDLVSTVIVEIDERCGVTIVEQEVRAPLAPEISSVVRESVEVSSESSSIGENTSHFAPMALYGNYVRSSQTLQDILSIDIAKFKWTHDRQWDDVYNATRFKAASECCDVYWGESSTSVAWNHPVGAYFDTADTTWQPTIARSFAHGSFHSDFLWCNLQPGQNFTLSTELQSWAPGGYDAKFRQSQTCSGTHMATSKWTSITPPPY